MGAPVFGPWAVHGDKGKLAGVLQLEGMGEGDPQGLYLLLGAKLSCWALFSSQSSTWTSGSSVTSSGHSLAHLSSVGIERQATEGHTHPHLNPTLSQSSWNLPEAGG